MTPDGIYDNPSTASREAWRRGRVAMAITREFLAEPNAQAFISAEYGSAFLRPWGTFPAPPDRLKLTDADRGARGPRTDDWDNPSTFGQDAVSAFAQRHSKDRT